jgi:phosphoglycolate phosphatase
MLAVATGKTRKGLDRAFEVSGLGPRFHASRCADECHSKPHPQMLEELMAEFGVRRRRR